MYKVKVIKVQLRIYKHTLVSNYTVLRYLIAMSKLTKREYYIECNFSSKNLISDIKRLDLIKPEYCKEGSLL